MHELLTVWLEDNTGRLTQLGIETQVSMQGEGRKPGAWVKLTAPRVLADVMVWHSGECEYSVATINDSSVVTVQRAVVDGETMGAVMEEVLTKLLSEHRGGRE